MNVIIPMAGMGTRMRPLTLRTPKPLLKILGRSIVDHLVRTIKDIAGQKVDNVGFVVGNFGKEIENQLLTVAQEIGAKGHIFYQPEALGTGHAIWCARPLLQGKVIVAFADTLLEMGPLKSFDNNYLLVKKVANPEDFGVVETNHDGVIHRFVEKPKQFVSDLALIGVYAFANGEKLGQALDYLIDNNIRVGKEYQLTTALENMKNDGDTFKVAVVDEWYDFGNPKVSMESAFQILGKHEKQDRFLPDNVKIVEPCYIGTNCKLTNCTIGPNVIIENEVKITDSNLTNCIIYSGSQLSSVNLVWSYMGENCAVSSFDGTIIAGDFTRIE